jgi:hypothetical protein
LFRSRITIVAALTLLAVGLLTTTTAVAAPGRVFAQDVGEGEEGAQPGEDQESSGGEDEGGSGQNDPESQTDPEEGGEEGEAETGPPWTYQMAWMGLLLAVVAMAFIGFLYYRLVVRRARGTT